VLLLVESRGLNIPREPDRGLRCTVYEGALLVLLWQPVADRGVQPLTLILHQPLKYRGSLLRRAVGTRFDETGAAFRGPSVRRLVAILSVWRFILSISSAWLSSR
jgi:hypothetical protein